MSLQALDREGIMQALFDRLSTKLGTAIIFKARKYVDFSQIPLDEQPALLVVATKNTLARQVGGSPAKQKINALVVLYVRDDNSDVDLTRQPETVMNSLVAIVEDALRFQNDGSDQVNGPECLNSNSTTLGGRVRYTYMLDVEYHHGAGTGQAAVTIALEMLAVDF